MGFDGAVGVSGDFVGIFINIIGFFETVFDIAFADFTEVGNIGAGFWEKPGYVFIVFEIGVDAGSFFLFFLSLVEGVEDVEEGFEGCIIDFNEFGSSFSCSGVTGDNGGDLFADEPGAVLGEDVPVVHIESEAVGELFPGDDFHDAFDGFGFGGIDAVDFSVVRLLLFIL